jgi:hypothetical protein
MSKIYIGDVGTEIILDCGVSLADASLLEIRAKKPSGAAVAWPATLEAPNSLKHVILSGELDESGVWALQAYVVTPTWSGRGETVRMTVSGEYA